MIFGEECTRDRAIEEGGTMEALTRGTSIEGGGGGSLKLLEFNWLLLGADWL